SARRLMPGDRARVTRALEVILATGRSLTDWHREGMKPALDPDAAVKVFLDVERAELYRRIDARFDAMLASGALEEVRALARRNADATPRRHESARRAVAGPASQRRDRFGRGGGWGKARHAALQQAAGHLVSPSAAGLDLGHARHGAGRNPPRARALTRG